MTKTICYAILLGALAGLLILSCSDSDPAGPGGGGGPIDDPTHLPEIPIPAHYDSSLPAASKEIDVGLSAVMIDFEPIVEQLERMKDDGSTAWSIEDRRLKMVCDGLRAQYACDEALADRGYVTESPRLLHKRYWKRLRHVVLDPGAGYSQEVEVVFGSSTTNTHSQSFSQTIGVEVSATAGWGAFSATVTASYEQTSTSEQSKSVTYSETASFKDVFTAPVDENKIIVYTIWQLVDVFVLADKDKVPIHQSETLAHVAIPEIPRVEFLNREVVWQSVTRFDP